MRQFFSCHKPLSLFFTTKWHVLTCVDASKGDVLHFSVAIQCVINRFSQVQVSTNSCLECEIFKHGGSLMISVVLPDVMCSFSYCDSTEKD